MLANETDKVLRVAAEIWLRERGQAITPYISAHYNQDPALQLAFRMHVENETARESFAWDKMKLFKRVYFLTALVCAGFLLESFLPIQLF